MTRDTREIMACPDCWRRDPDPLTDEEAALLPEAKEDQARERDHDETVDLMYKVFSTDEMCRQVNARRLAERLWLRGYKMVRRER